MMSAFVRVSVRVSGENRKIPPTPPLSTLKGAPRYYCPGFCPGLSGFGKSREFFSVRRGFAPAPPGSDGVRKSVRRRSFVEPAWWNPPQPLLQCIECETIYRYDGVSGNCVVCGNMDRAIVIEPAAKLVEIPVEPVRQRHGWRENSLRLRFEVFKRDGYRCQICGATAADGARLEPDHKIPKARGGPDSLDNLWTLCFSCNRGKSSQEL